MIRNKYHIIKWLNKRYNNLLKVESSNNTHFYSNEKIILEYSDNVQYILVDYDLWAFCQDWFELDYFDVQDIFDEWVNKTLGINKTPIMNIMF